MIKSALSPSGLEDDEDGGEVDEDELDEEHWREYRQKVQAWDLVALYASILQGDWPMGLDLDEETGISSIVRL